MHCNASGSFVSLGIGFLMVVCMCISLQMSGDRDFVSDSVCERHVHHGRESQTPRRGT